MLPSTYCRKKKKNKHQVRITEPDESVTNGWELEIPGTTTPRAYELFTPFLSESQSSEYVVDPEPNTTGFPWLQLQEYPIYLSAHERLQKEALSLFQYLRPVPQEKALRQRIIDFIENKAQERWPHSKAFVFGSFSTELYLPTSDLDIVLKVSCTADPEDLLEEFLDCLKRSMELDHYEIRRSARVPIINLTEARTGMQIDISINIPKGIESSKKIVHFLSEYPVVRPLSMILRHFLLIHRLHKVYDGGLGSYAATLLIVNFIQVHPDLNSKAREGELYLWELLIGFFKFYGTVFNPTELGISLLNGGFHFNRVKNKQPISEQVDAPNSQLLLLDPADETNNVTQSTTRMFDIQTVFKDAYSSLVKNLRAYQQKQQNNEDLLYKDSILGTIGYISPSILSLRVKYKSISKKK